MTQGIKAIGFAFVAIFLLTSTQGQAQDYTVSGQVKNLAHTDIYLANYYGNKLYYSDTVRTDGDGNFSFPGKGYDKQGKYAFVIPGPKYFDFLIAGEDVYLETDTNLFVPDVVFKKSIDNQVFFEYIKYISDMRKQRTACDSILVKDEFGEKQKEECRDMIASMNDDVVAYQKKLIEEHGDRMVGKFINMTLDVQVPKIIPADADTAQWRYEWYKSHYWDNCDLSDNRMVREQSIHKLLDRYINSVIPQVPDSVCVEAKRLIDKVVDQPDLFKYFVHYITHNSESSKLMCMDRVFVYMVNNYFKTGKAHWMSDEKLKEVIEAADKKSNVLCNEVFPNIILSDMTDTNWVAVRDVESKYTIVAIWETTCGHCKKELPKLMEVYNDWKDLGLKVYAIGNDYERMEWKEYVAEKELGDWIHVSDDPLIGNDHPDTVRYVLMNGITNIESLNYRQTLDIQSTPKLFLLDEDKHIVAKQLNSGQLHDLLVNLEGYDPTGGKEDDSEEKDDSHGQNNPPKDKKRGKKKKESDTK